MHDASTYSTFDIRFRAIEAIERGLPKNQVALAYGIDRSTLYRWIENYQQDGVEGLHRKEGSGRPKLLEELTEQTGTRVSELKIMFTATRFYSRYSHCCPLSLECGIEGIIF